jgi:3-hydroxyacyl-CoA dehydrogenase
VAADDPHSVTILGAGSIGLSFAAVLTDCGAAVTLAEPDPERRAAAQAGLAVQAEAIRTAGLSRGLSGALTVVAEAGDAPATAEMVIECGPERLEAKQAIFADLLRRAGPATILATASSAIPMSRILPDPETQARCLVAHPVNPPAVLRLIELAPAPGTTPEALDRTAALFRALGFAPVTLRREVEGFLLNRLQGAVLREAYRLVAEDVASSTDLDTVMRLGLGPRWALSGPFETAELNTPGGIVAHAERMGPAYRRMGEARGETVDWTPELVARVETERRAVLPAEDLPARAAWRVGAVARMVAARDRIERGGDD